MPSASTRRFDVTTAEFAVYGDRRLRLDLRRAAEPTAPTVVYLHGGAWVVGTRADHPARLDGLAAAGVTVASIDYRLVVEAPFPAQRADIEAAVDWLIDAGIAPSPSGVVLMGASAGAHLAALACLTSRYRFAGFVGLFGRYDLSSWTESLLPIPGLPIPAEIISNTLPQGLEMPRKRVAALAGVTPDKLTEELLLGLSPVSHLTPGSPPLLLLHGLADALVHHAHTSYFADRANHVGVPCEVINIPAANHEDPLFDSAQYLDRIATFVKQVTTTEIQKRAV